MIAGAGNRQNQPRVHAMTTTPLRAAAPPRPAQQLRHYTRYSSHVRSQEVWDKIKAPSGAKLYCQLMLAFVVLFIFGVVFVVVGGYYVSPAHRHHKTSGYSLPLSLCIVAIVAGTLLIGVSCIIGPLIISSKWKRTTGAAPETPTVRYVRDAPPDQDGPTLPEYRESEPPPPYPGHGLPTSESSTTGHNINAPSSLSHPPSYAELASEGAVQPGISPLHVPDVTFYTVNDLPPPPVYTAEPQSPPETVSVSASS